ncbi:hypothetical protein ACVWZB_001082 [Paenibacillus polymyxa]|jgi:hypothetical protein
MAEGRQGPDTLRGTSIKIKLGCFSYEAEPGFFCSLYFADDSSLGITTHIAILPPSSVTCRYDKMKSNTNKTSLY